MKTVHIIVLAFFFFLGWLSCEPDRKSPEIGEVETLCDPLRVLIINGKSFETAIYRDIICGSGPPTSDDTFGVVLEDESESYELIVVQWQDMSRITAKIPDEVPDGTYQLTVTDPYGNTDTTKVDIRCPGKDTDTEPETDTDTDVDTDSDTDNDIDTDIDTDTNTDTDIDTDTDTDTDTDIDTSHLGCVVFVNEKNTGSNLDGLTWKTAFVDPQNGIDAAYDRIQNNASSSCEVWVAKGTYYIYRNSPTDTIKLMPEVAVYGGFEGTQTAREDRDWNQNPTFLSGHSGPEQTSHVFHVVTGSDDAVLDGFTITGGNANSPNNKSDRFGGGMINNSSSPSVTNCVFRRNWALASGGAMFNSKSIVTITNCVFERNSAQQSGGGIHNEDASPTMVNCSLTNNQAISAGGISNTQSSSQTVTNSILWKNSAQQILDDESSSTTITYSAVQGGFYGRGNIDENPLFVDIQKNDLHLQKDSPCIDAAKGIDAPIFDMEKKERIDNPRSANTGLGPPWADMGVYEYH